MDVVSKVVLFSMPRTGSTMVTRQISTHPKIKFVGSIFGERGWCGIGRHYRELHEGLADQWEDLNYRIEHHKKLLDKWFAAAEPGGSAGVKQHLSGPAEVTETLIADPTVGTILLTRSNSLACYSSDKVTRLTARGELPEGGKATFDPKEFEHFAERRRAIYERWRPKIAGRAGPSLEIDYVDARRQSGIERIVSFLGLDPKQVEAPRTRKRNSDDIVSRFQNPDAVLRYLEDNGLQQWRTEEGPDEADRPQRPEAAVDPAIAAERVARRKERMAPRKAERLRRHQAALEALGVNSNRTRHN